MKKITAISSIAALGIAALVSLPSVYAATNTDSQLTQVIGNGTLSTSIRDASGNIVASPSFAMNDVSASTSMQTATGTFGADGQRITVDNPGGADNGWTLAINATTPGTGTWISGSDTYSYNGATAADGQLTLDPSIATLTVNSPATNTGITKGSQATFSGTTPLTLLTAGSTADHIWNGYITGVGVSQTIPASQPTGTYTLDLTQTVTAQ